METPLPGGLENSGQRAYCLYWNISRDFGRFNDFLRFGFLQISLLGIVGEVPGGGSNAVAVAVAVGVSDR